MNIDFLVHDGFSRAVTHCMVKEQVRTRVRCSLDFRGKSLDGVRGKRLVISELTSVSLGGTLGTVSGKVHLGESRWPEFPFGEGARPNTPSGTQPGGSCNRASEFGNSNSTQRLSSVSGAWSLPRRGSPLLIRRRHEIHWRHGNNTAPAVFPTSIETPGELQ